MTHMKRTALYAGSFDPFTRGHADIVARGLCLFDEVIVGIGTNDASATSSLQRSACCRSLVTMQMSLVCAS